MTLMYHLPLIQHIYIKNNKSQLLYFINYNIILYLIVKFHIYFFNMRKQMI